MNKSYSVIIPAYNEEGAIASVIGDLVKILGKSVEIIVVDDCSRDRTAAEAAAQPTVKVLRNVTNFGYGYSLKRGIGAATHEHIIIIDADGSYPVSALPALISEYEKGFDMVVGARVGRYYHGTLLKRIARFFFRILSEFATGRSIPDINSGCRIFGRATAMSFFGTLSSGFSFTTTITLAFMLNAHSVTYLPIEYHKRQGASKVRYVRDTLRSLQIIVEAIIFYNPIKIFLLCGIAAIICGIVSIALAFFSVLVALFFFMTACLTLISLQIGFVAVLLKFKLSRVS